MSALRCVDPSTLSRVLVTTRVKGLVPDVEEFPVGVLEPDEAVALMLKVAGRQTAPPFSSIEHSAAQASGLMLNTVRTVRCSCSVFGVQII